jgi:hypothetical protein
MSTRLVTLLWLFAVALLGLSGDRGAPDAVAARDVATLARHTASLLQAHHGLPAGDVTSNGAIGRGHLSMHRPVPGFSKRPALAGDELALSPATDHLAVVPAIESIASPPLIHNPARAPPA